MRRNRRGGNSRPEFGGSGEDSFVAVVVTKLTGALLFILLLTMVIMALLPKAVENSAPGTDGSDQGPPAERLPLSIATPERLPEAIAGRPYNVAMAATGGQGPLHWSIDGKLPEGLSFSTDTGLLEGTPKAGTPQPLQLALRVSDGSDIATSTARLVVYQSDTALTTPAWWKPGIPPIPWRAWLDQGVGFLLLWLVHLVGMNAISSLERSREAPADGERVPGRPDRRFSRYRWMVRLATVTAIVALAAWLWQSHGISA